MQSASERGRSRYWKSVALKKNYPLRRKNYDLVFTTVNEEPGIISTPLASALDCGSEGLKSSAPSSTRFSSSSDKQEKTKTGGKSHNYKLQIRGMLFYNTTHTKMDTHTCNINE